MFILLLSTPYLQAQNPVIVGADTTYILTIRSFDTLQLNQYHSNPDFFYDQKPPRPSLLEQLWQWLFGQKIDALDHTLSETWRLVRYIVVFLLVCLVVRRLMKADMTTLFFRPPPKASIPYTLLAEDIHRIDFDQQIQAAIAQQQYRKAVRLYYLNTLKILTDKDLIQWTADKTNQRYVYELQSHQLHQPFKQLTHLFDYVWYGDFALTTPTFADAQDQFIQFQQQIQQHA